MRANEIRSKHAHGESDEHNERERQKSAQGQLSEASVQKSHNLFAG